MLSNAIIEDVTLNKVKRALKSPPPPTKKERNFRSCSEINNCSLPTLLECKAFLKQKSCWLLSGDCLCRSKSHSNKDCGTCATYGEHRSELCDHLVGTPGAAEFPDKTFIDYIRPVVRDFLPSGRQYRSVDLRMERSLTKIAADFLKFWVKDKHGSYEKQLVEIYKSLFNG